MNDPLLLIDDEEQFNSSLKAVILAEKVVSYLLGGSLVRGVAIQEGEENQESKGASNGVERPTWCIRRGETSYGVDIRKLLPCETSFMRSRSLFEVAKSLKEGADCGEVPLGKWVLDEDLSEGAQVVRVTTGLGEILVGVERSDRIELHKVDLVGREGDRSVSLPIQLLLGEWKTSLSQLVGPISLISNGPVKVRMQGHDYVLVNDLVKGGIVMQSIEDSQSETIGRGVKEVDGDTDVLISVHLGEIQLKLSQLARLRKGHSLRLMEEYALANEGFHCSLTLGSTRIGSGKLRFSGDRVVLTVTEVL